MKFLILPVLLLVPLFIVFLMVRNEITYRIRNTFRNDPTYPYIWYERLPSYGDMCENPRYYLRWTAKHWLDWLWENDLL